MKKEKNPVLNIVVGVGHCFGNLLLMLDIVGVVYRIMWLIISVNVMAEILKTYLLYFKRLLVCLVGCFLVKCYVI